MRRADAASTCMQTEKTIVTANWAITATDSSTAIISDAIISWASDGKIIFFGKAQDYVDRHKETGLYAEVDPSIRRIDLGNAILCPGLVNAHTHAAMTLLRGAADDLPLMEWLQKRIWPMEGALVDPQFVEIGTQLAAAEMLLGGTTTCADMYFYPGDAARAFIAMGMRAQLAMPVIEFPTRYASDPDQYLSLALETRDALKGEALLSFALGPHAPYTVNDDTFKRIVAYSAELGIPIHTHLQETSNEVEESIAKFGERPTKRLERLGLLSPDFVGAHGVHVNAEDIARLAKNAANIVHCPSSNLKLASGIAPIDALTKAGVNVALGTDGAASNNRLDLFEEMRLAALLAKVQANDASAFPAEAAFRAATINGARALGLQDTIGSLEVGKQADVIAISLDGVHVQPMFDPISHVVYTAARADVSHTWVGGCARVADGKLAEDAQRVIDNASSTVAEIVERVAKMR
jgi:5-methylthioadenosine/S-adenosylhomocysteine deaminase